VKLEIRPVAGERYRELQRVLTIAFGEDIQEREAQAIRPIFDAGRTWGAFEGDDLVGVAADTEFELTVPGGTVPASGVHTVAVLPTHRRRGIMRELMRQQIEETHELGRPLSYLWASEGAIYQRLGYGLGTFAGMFEIDRQNTAFLQPVEPTGRMRLIDREEALKLLPTIYDRVRPTRPGVPSQPRIWWEHFFRHAQEHHSGVGKPLFAVRESLEGPDGYVMYMIKDAWKDEGPDQTLILEDLVAATDEAYAELWRYCFTVDLVRHVAGIWRPADEPLLHMLAEPRALRFRLRDGAWLRIVDVSSALEGRRYRSEGSVRFEVRDELAPWNEGSWELEGGLDGASCRSTDGEPDLVLGVADLSAMYFGTVAPSTLARAGRVEERTDGALRRADAMFGWDVAPWCPHVF
jgi:predicted acetyltransferase